MDYAARYIRELQSSTALMRKFAARYLKEYGDERAFGPLAEALSDPEEEVRREAAATLGKIGDPSVIEALKAATKDRDPKVATAAAKAVESVRKRHPAPIGRPARARPARRRDRSAFLERALDGTGARIEKRDYGYKVRLRLVGGRRQDVRVVFDKSDPEGDAILLVFTVCGPAEPRHFRWALKANVRTTYGSMALWKRGGEEQFVLIETLLEADTTEDELRKVILTLAEKGDKIEASLSETDAF